MVLLYLPLAWIGSRIFVITGVFWAAVIANTIAGSISLFYLRRTLRVMRQEQGIELSQVSV
ncbi:MAG: hypothetical protein WAV84_15460 [Bacteroidota bacterium]